MVKKLELISNKKERLRAYHRAKTVLLKKAHELSVLCDVKLGLMILSPVRDRGSIVVDDDDDQLDYQTPLIWPPENQKQVIHPLIHTYWKSGESSSLVNKKHYDDSDSVLNDPSKCPTWDHQLDTLSNQELLRFRAVLEDNINAIKCQVDDLKKQQHLPPPKKSSDVSYDSIFSTTHQNISQPVVNIPSPPQDIDTACVEVPAPTNNYGYGYGYGQEDIQAKDPGGMDNMFRSDHLSIMQSSFDMMNNMDGSYDPLFLATHQTLFETNVWQPMTMSIPPKDSRPGCVEVPFKHIFDGYGQDPLMSRHCAPTMHPSYPMQSIELFAAETQSFGGSLVF